jgi:hypothetical protein
LCHRNYDDLDPGLLFIPTDLDWFINFEERDQKRRTELMENTQAPPPARVPPAPEVYHAYQMQEGLVAEEEIGGLYNCYILRDYLPRFRPDSAVGLSLFFQTPRAWHGSPTAAIVRATSLIGRLHNKLPRDIVRKLFKLSELYSQNIEYQPPLSRGRGWADPGDTGQGSPGQERSNVARQQQPGDTDRTGQHARGNISGSASPTRNSDGQVRDHMRAAQPTRSKDENAGVARRLSQTSPVMDTDPESVRPVTAQTIQGNNRNKRKRNMACSANPTWGPGSTSALAMSFFIDVKSFSIGGRDKGVPKGRLNDWEGHGTDGRVEPGDTLDRKVLVVYHH